jgi:hypothetical protein
LDRRNIALVWVGGIILMLAVYAIGPQNFLASCEAFIRAAAHFLDGLIATLMWRAFEVMRAAAIALFVVFIVLGAMAMRGGQRVGSMLVVVSIAFLLLVRTDWYDPGTKWLAAAVLAGVAAAMMTRRLLHAPPPRAPENPWGRFYRGDGGPVP